MSADPESQEEKPKRGRPVSKREDIVRAAVKVFLEKGYSGTSVNQVAAEAGVIKATIYSHFKDKEALYSAIIEQITIKKMDVTFEQVEAMLPNLSPQQFVELLYSKFRMLEQDKEYIGLVRILVADSQRFPELTDLYLKVVLRPGMGLARRFFELHPELGVEDSFAAAHLVCGAFWSLLFWQRLLGGMKTDLLESHRVRDMLIDLLNSKQIAKNIKDGSAPD